MATETAPTTFGEVMHLEQHGSDTWVGLSPAYSWGRVYGGQVICQGLWAALKTVDERFAPHSVHAYFIRGGSVAEPIRYEVDRLRDGRSFCTRAVVARQSGGAILNLSCSFQAAERDAEVQTARIPPAPEPEDCRRTDVESWPWIMDRRQLVSHPGAGQSMGWVRIVDPMPDEARHHVCALAFTSDAIHFSSARSLHPLQVSRAEYREKFMGASLDHAMWFHRPMRADEWHLYHFDCHGLTGARGMTVGNLFSPDGRHIATIAQEVLLRERKPR
ncbi:MAG TPA: acyl-CoA thioesterase II [Acidimicrobiaceae bacterium]|nr:acyl-CoA thioesterase II [Acidimicrobiaceae bacterium]HCB37583.1 acyl-CoA thioesterase II [Acidimicrobiaceae bacterium]